jgi:cytochrome b subunit of formate dehydrogenase/nitrate/TMAO reductase-like tetraheme cytochrome c subunit
MASISGAAEPGAAPGAGQAVVKEACTDGCHEEVVNENPKHKGLKCVECHPNIPDGKAEHKSALSDTPSDVMCAYSGCHEADTRKTLEGKHKDAPCETCHGTVHDAFLLNDEKACRQCHKKEVVAHAEGMHAKAKKPVHCADCHGDMHDIKLKSDPLSPMSKVLQVTTCGECHDTEKVRAFRKSVHGQGLLRSGLNVAPSCSSCHGSHEMTKVKDPESKVGRAKITETCGQCHNFIVARWKRSQHGETFAKEKADDKVKAPVCIDCHSGHETVDPTVDNNALAMVSKCEKCHESQSLSYRNSFHGKATKLGLGVAATCASCHTPHDMRKAKDASSSVNPLHLKATCQQCHPTANDAFVEFLPHNEPSDPKGNRVLYIIWLFMTTLLTATLGFFTVHTLLWLQRSVVGFMRHEFDHGAAGPVWIRRFRPVHIWIHLMIVTTFLLLAATGLPLKFSAEPWAQGVATLMGGAGFARLLHRLAGILTFVYGAWFLGYLIREIIVRKRRGLLFGWQSMVPNLKDLQDVIGNLKWFLYLGPRPRLDRWAYWEKFDFFAVFWGVPVIGFSGLFLWFPTLATQVLPGWALNIAYLVHSDEALLATGFIFLFHFFHTHLRPEAFPLDPVIFAGAMPLERFKAERPVEYERLLASGELESYQVPPPAPEVMTRIYRAGFTFLAIGTILGVLLITVFVRGLLHG